MGFIEKPLNVWINVFQRILALVKKEILTFWNDTRSRFVLFVPPLMQLLIFSFAATLDVKNVPIGIVNEDAGGASIELIERFKGSPTFSKIFFLDSKSQIPEYIDNQKVAMVMFIDPQFSRLVEAGLPADVQLVLDGRRSNTAQILAGYSSRILQVYNQDLNVKNGRIEQKTTVVAYNKFNPNLIYYWYNVPCLSGVLTMMIGLVITSLSIAREREMGTFDQLLVSPLSSFEILIGKMIPGIIVGMIEGSIIIFAGIFIFQIPFSGSLLYIYFCMFFFITSVVGIGLFLSSLCSTQQQAVLGTFIFMTPAVTLSGFATPIENMPYWLQYVTYINPLRYYIIVAKGEFMKAMPFSVVWHNVWPLIIIAFFTASAASWLFRKRSIN